MNSLSFNTRIYVPNTRAKNNAGNQLFDRNLGSWDTSKVTSLRSAFDSAKSFRGIGLTNWNVDSVTEFRDVFRNTSSMSNCTKRAVRSSWYVVSCSSTSFSNTHARTHTGSRTNISFVYTERIMKTCRVIWKSVPIRIRTQRC